MASIGKYLGDKVGRHCSGVGVGRWVGRCLHLLLLDEYQVEIDELKAACHLALKEASTLRASKESLQG